MNELKIPSIIVHKGKKEEKYKLYVEDYVVSYLKYRAQRMETGTIFFYGKKEEQIYLIYGAGKNESIPEFAKYQLLQEISWSFTQAGAFFFVQEAGERYRVQGYDIFYQTNEEMQNYMIDEKRGQSDTGRGQASVRVVESDEPAELDKWAETELRPEITQAKGTKRRGGLEKCMEAAQAAADGREKEHMPRLISLQLCAIFLLLTAIVIVSVDSYGKMGDLIQNAKEVFFVMENEEKQREYQNTAEEKTETEQVAGKSNEDADTQADGVEMMQSSDGTEPEMQAAQPDEKEMTDMAGTGEDVEKETETAQPDGTETEQALSRNVTRYYEVEKGDTLYTISREIYGDISKVQQICELNQIENPDNISYGQKIILP